MLDNDAYDREQERKALDKLMASAGAPLPEDMAALEKLGPPFPIKRDGADAPRR
jgi:hypothetical protein